MARTLLLAVIASLVLAVPASAGYPSTFAVQGGQGIVDGQVRYTAAKAGGDTRVAVVDAGAVVRSAVLDGAFGIATLGIHDTGIGLFRDRSAIVLQSMLRPGTTTFRIVKTADLSVLDTFTLKGIFAFDALSPDGSTLYLVEHQSVEDIEHYIVRSYDLSSHELRAGRIADKTQKTWVMRGYPVARASTGDGRWVYTMYANPAGFPFVHALDTVRGVAHCVGFNFKGDQSRLLNFHLGVKKSLLVIRQSDLSLYRLIDRTTWAVRRK